MFNLFTRSIQICCCVMYHRCLILDCFCTLCFLKAGADYFMIVHFFLTLVTFSSTVQSTSNEPQPSSSSSLPPRAHDHHTSPPAAGDDASPQHLARARTPLSTASTTPRTHHPTPSTPACPPPGMPRLRRTGPAPSLPVFVSVLPPLLTLTN